SRVFVLNDSWPLSCGPTPSARRGSRLNLDPGTLGSVASCSPKNPKPGIGPCQKVRASISAGPRELTADGERGVAICLVARGGRIRKGKWQMANGRWQMADGKWRRAEGGGRRASRADILTGSVPGDDCFPRGHQ